MQLGIRSVFSKAISVLREGGLRGLNARARYFFNQTVIYRRWVARNDVLTVGDVNEIALRIEAMAYQPVFSVLMPVHNPSLAHLRHAIASVIAQLYPKWELCIADDASDDPLIAQAIEVFCRKDDRIKFVQRPQRGHISAASNSCLEIAQGEFIALLDHDDVLAPQALYLVACALNHRSDLSLIYSDEDKINEKGIRTWPHFKPDWNADLMRSQNAVNHLGVYRTTVVRGLGGFRVGVEGCQDWDLALRVSEKIKISCILHLPYVLYHWRITSQSTALDTAPKRYVTESGKKVVTDHLKRMGEQAEVVPIYGSYFRVKYRLDNPPAVAVISRIANATLMERLVKSLTIDTLYPNLTLYLLIDPHQRHKLVKFELIAATSHLKVVLLECATNANLSERIDYAIDHIKQTVLCFFDPECVPSGNDWLTELVSHATRSAIGAAGAKLFRPNGTVYSGGTVLGLGRNRIAGAIYAGTPRGDGGAAGRAGLIQNYSAVSARCMVVRRDVFMEVEGFDRELPLVDSGDIDFCLRVGELGYRVVWTPFAELVWHGPTSEPSRDVNVAHAMKMRWKQKLAADPAHNPNLSLDGSFPTLARSPRVPFCSAYRAETEMK